MPYLYDGITGSLEEEAAFARGIEAHGGIDLVHLDEHGWLCSFIASHEWDRDNPGRTDKLWIKVQIIEMVTNVKKQIRAPRILLVDPAESENSRSTNTESYSIGPREVFSVPCDWRDEISGHLARAVVLYLQGQQLSSGEVGALRTYFRQWIQSPVWDMNSHATIESRRSLGELRASVEGIRSAVDIARWLYGGMKLGLYPLP